jgi:hypothetical protein
MDDPDGRRRDHDAPCYGESAMDPRPINGEPQMFSLRATQISRRADGKWKDVHRHADTVPDADKTLVID